MNREQSLLNHLAEECSELAQIASKAIRFEMDSDNNGQLEFTNEQRIIQEFNDLYAVITLLFPQQYIIDDEMIERKIEKINKYSERSKLLGKINN